MQNNVCILLLFTLLAYVHGARIVTGGSKLGESCEYDDDCDVTYSYCRAQQTCECKRGFEPGPTRDRCMATVGAICSTNYDCTGLPNSECSQEVCACKNGYVPHPSMKECLQGARIYQASCVENVQCTEGYGTRIECRDTKCVCIPMHHFVEGVCIQSKKLDEQCSDTKECHVSDDPEKNKNVVCTAGRCQCAIGYHMAEDHLTCTDGAAQLSAFSLLAVSVIYALTRFLH